MKSNIEWYSVALGILVTLLAQTGAWFQHNLQFKYPKLDSSWWGWYVVAIPLTFLFVKATELMVKGFGGYLWAGRFVGFSVGIFVYAIFNSIIMDQGVDSKVFTQLSLAFTIIAIQVWWK